MSSSLAIRSHPNIRYKLRAPYPTSDVSHTSTSVAQARQHRPAVQDDYWQSRFAVTYVDAGTKVSNPYALQDESDGPAYPTHPPHQSQPVDPQHAPPSPQEAQPTNYDLAFPSLPKTDGLGGQAVEANQRHYFGSLNVARHEFGCASQPHQPQSAFEAPLYAYPEFSQNFISPVAHTAEPTLYYDESVQAAQYNDSYQPDAGSVHSRPHTSCHNEPYALAVPTTYAERRASIVSSVSHDEPFTYRAADHQGGAYSPPRYGLVHHMPHSSSAPLAPTPPAPSAPGEQQPQSLTLAPHTLTGSLPPGPLTPMESEPAPPTVTSSPPVPEVGSVKSVRRRRETTADTGYQQSDQRAMANQTPKRTKTNRPTSVKSRWHKPDQRSSEFTSSSSSDDEISSLGNEDSERGPQSVDAPETKLRELASRYKAAYKRVRLQRNFFEGTTVSLLHEVRIMGGDPLQASRRPPKGEDMDPREAMILIASLQGDLEDSRERLLKAETELHRLRGIVDDTPRPFQSLANDDSKAPLSAAPKTVFAHLKK